jgi:uncharacterized membrane protein YphA (DoxX/SURF4 family)
MAYGLLLLRVVAGGTIFAHGTQKLFGWFGGHGLPGQGASRRDGLENDAGEPLGSPAPIGVPRFELGTSPTRTERATRLRHTPKRHTE